MALMDSVPGFVELLASTQPKDPETLETVELLRTAVQLELEPGGLLFDDGTTFELKSIRNPLKAYVYARQNPTAAIAVPVVTVLVLLGAGYLIGKSVGGGR